ncbi:MAG: NAD(P)-dependent oxidoreductase [Nitrososphaerota archaeon]|nr:NAD(P)-dependent oxidoreductase [Nitrososphaerota archaeon]
MSTQVKPNRIGPFPFPKSDPEVRKKDFSEVQQLYTGEQVVQEASRCLLCGTPVCIDACPVQMDVRGMCEAVSRKDFATAYHRIRETNPLVGVTARCCPQLQGLCEDACVMRWDGQPISIGMIQRFVSDWEQDEKRQPDRARAADTGKHVAIVGAGPSGVAAAELLSRYGHSVVVYEESESPGGTAWYGIPDYHLPKDVLLYEIRRVTSNGVTLKTGIKVGQDVMITHLLSDGADAVLIATGSKDVTKLETPGIDLQGVIDGYEFLEDVFTNEVSNYAKSPKYDLGSDILVIGGGDSALDCARTALRLTNGNVTLVYRRTENEMPADPIMVDEAKEEGVQFKFLTDPKEYLGRNGRLDSVVMNAMELGEPDSTGRRSPVPSPGKEFTIKCTTVLLAVGRGPDSFLQKKIGLKTGKKNSILVDDCFKTSMTAVFASGDVTTGETLVVRAMGSGRNAAQRIHEYLMGLEDKHISLYEQYFSQRSFEKLMRGEEEKASPPPP